MSMHEWDKQRIYGGKPYRPFKIETPSKTDWILIVMWENGPMSSYQIAKKARVYVRAGGNIVRLASGAPRPDAQSVYQHLKAPINKGFVNQHQEFSPKIGKTIWIFSLSKKGITYLKEKNLI